MENERNSKVSLKRSREKPVFRRSTRKIPTFSFPFFLIAVPDLRFSFYLRQIFKCPFGAFFIEKFFVYVIIIVLYSTLFREQLWHII